MSDETIRKARAEMRSYLDSTGASLTSIGRDLGISAGALSLFMNDKYTGDNGKVAAGIRAFMDRLRARRGLLRIPVIRTRPYQDTVDTLGMTEAEGVMSLIVGDNGSGKTVAVKDYAERHDAILIESDPGDTPLSILRQLSVHLGLASRGTIQTLRDAIIQNAPQKLLIVDEAENLPINSLNFIRRIYDKSRLSVALVGGPDVRGMFRNMRRDNKYLWRRIKIHVALGPLTDDDVDRIIAATGMRVTDSARRKLKDISQMNIGVLMNLLEMCHKITRASGAQVTNDIIATARRLLLV